MKGRKGEGSERRKERLSKYVDGKDRGKEGEER